MSAKDRDGVHVCYPAHVMPVYSAPDLLRRSVAAMAITALVLMAWGCENTTPSDDERAAVEEVVHAYLEGLADAYSTVDASHLEEVATGSEIAAVQKLLRGLVASGDRVDATLHGLEIESMEIFREINATVTLLEVWDVARFDAHTGREKGRNPDSVQNTIIQLRLMDGRWKVTARRVVGESQSRWKVTTPIPDVSEDDS